MKKNTFYTHSNDDSFSRERPRTSGVHRNKSRTRGRPTALYAHCRVVTRAHVLCSIYFIIAIASAHFRTRKNTVEFKPRIAHSQTPSNSHCNEFVRRPIFYIGIRILLRYSWVLYNMRCFEYWYQSITVTCGSFIMWTKWSQRISRSQ